MNDAQFNKLCCNSSVTRAHIEDYLTEYENDAALAIDTIHGMAPLVMLSMNPHATADTIAALLNVDIEVTFRLDNKGQMSLDCEQEYNVSDLVAIINVFCNKRYRMGMMLGILYINCHDSCVTS